MQEYSLLTERLRQRTTRKPVYVDEEDGMDEEEWEEEEAAEEGGEEEDEEKEVLKMEQVCICSGRYDINNNAKNVLM